VSGVCGASAPSSGSSGWSDFLEGFFLAIYGKDFVNTEGTEFTEE
jgi:hypothetical protein